MNKVERLEKEVELLRRKISPLEDKEFTRAFSEDLALCDLDQFKRDFRGAPHLVVHPAELWRLVLGTEPDTHDITVLGRTLQALLWERSALNGARVFVKPYEEYLDEP